MDWSRCRGWAFGFAVVTLFLAESGAAEVAGFKSKEKKAPAKPVQVSEDGMGQSERARSTKDWGIGARLGGLIEFGGGIEGFRSLDSKTQIGLLIGGGGTKSSYSSVEYNYRRNIRVYEGTVSSSVLLAQVRYFFLNSFFGTVGAGSRVITAKYDVESYSSSKEKLKLDTVTSGLVVSASIGNVWTWDGGFYLGADWIGLIVPVTSSTKKTKELTGSGNKDLTDFEDGADAAAAKAGREPSAIAALMTIGYSF